MELDELKSIKLEAFVVYGSTLAFLTLGIFTDFLAQRNLYTLLAIIISLQIFLVFIQAIYMICK